MSQILNFGLHKINRKLATLTATETLLWWSIKLFSSKWVTFHVFNAPTPVFNKQHQPIWRSLLVMY